MCGYLAARRALREVLRRQIFPALPTASMLAMYRLQARRNP
jgi:hypothetical protein